MARHVARSGDVGRACIFLAAKPLGRTGLSWEGNTEAFFRETGRESADWIHLALNIATGSCEDCNASPSSTLA